MGGFSVGNKSMKEYVSLEEVSALFCRRIQGLVNLFPWSYIVCVSVLKDSCSQLKISKPFFKDDLNVCCVVVLHSFYVSSFLNIRYVCF